MCRSSAPAVTKRLHVYEYEKCNDASSFERARAQIRMQYTYYALCFVLCVVSSAMLRQWNLGNDNVIRLHMLRHVTTVLLYR